MNDHYEFTVRLIPERKTIQIRGELTAEGPSFAAERELRKLAGCSHEGKWTVDAQQASILQGGAQRWLKLVDSYLREYDLVYPPSQLALILLCDDEYRKRYPRTVFLEEELISPA